MALLPQRKFVVAAAIVGSALILTGLGLLFDCLVGSGSTVVLLIASVPLAIAVVAVLAGFHWVLDHCADSAILPTSTKTAKRRSAQRPIGRQVTA